jgi:ribosomal protein S18 acetylase RimI-like enzyme
MPSLRHGRQVTVPVRSTPTLSDDELLHPATSTMVATAATSAAEPALRIEPPYCAAMFRLSARADPAFLAEMLYEAINWHDDGAEERPPLDAVVGKDENARYIAGWGRAGDVALCALDRRDEPVGAAWYRRLSAATPGYGYVSDDVPELAIGVYPEFRGQRVGSLLLGALLARARRDRERAISLSVHRANPAKRLFARHGFEVVGEHEDTVTMVVDLT